MVNHYISIGEAVRSLLKGRLCLEKVCTKRKLSDILRKLHHRGVNCDIFWLVFPLGSKFEEYWERYRRELEERGLGDIANDVAYLLAYNKILSEFRVNVKRMTYVTDKKAAEEIDELIHRRKLKLAFKPEIHSLEEIPSLSDC